MRQRDEFQARDWSEAHHTAKDPGAIRIPLQRAAHHATHFRETIASRPQRTLHGYMQSLDAFREAVPEAGNEEVAVIDDLVARAEPGLHAMTGPRFFGWVIGGSHPVGVAADWLTSAWGQNAGNHHAAPAAAAIETVAGGWLVDLLDLPRRSSVGFVTGATMANFTGLAAARGSVLRRAGWDVDTRGLFGAPPITVLIGDDAHTTVFSALQFLGLGHDRVVRVKTDRNGRMMSESFAAAAERISGPGIVILQAGQINTGAFDDFRALVPLARKADVWIHVDGAFGLWARACPDRKHLTHGLDEADSWAVDGHKWLQTPYDCGYAIVRDEEAHRRAMTIAASYLPSAQEGERDPTHFVPELSRRARGFATWAMIKHLGRTGIAAMIERNCRVAHGIAEHLRENSGIAILNDVVLNQVLVRFGVDGPDDEADRLTELTIRQIQSDGVCFTSGAKWRGRQAMRISVTSWFTDEEQGKIAADAILSAWHAARQRAEAGSS
jgi:glutamate/tyrosine decarboxylase-like PLP-dependent enzyme